MSVDVVSPQAGLEDPFKEESLDNKSHSLPTADGESQSKETSDGESQSVPAKQKSQSPSAPTEEAAQKAAKPAKAKKAKKPKAQSDEEEDNGILNFDPTADLNDLDAEEVTKGVGSQEHLTHIRIQQRNGRKALTTIQGLPKKYDQKKILKHIKKEFACNGLIVDDEKFGNVIQLQGDQRHKAKDFLKEMGICKETEIKIHGF